MRSFPIVLSLSLLAFLGAALTAQQAPPAAPARPAAPRPAAQPARAAAGYQTVGTIKEVMEGIVDPAADLLWDSVSYSITAAGIQETLPRTDADWLKLRWNALLLVEAANILKVPGRKVAPDKPIPGLENEPPAPEDLTPAEIQKLIDADRATFNRLAQGLADAALLSLKAADARSIDGLFEAGDDLDEACENCHIKYWYPKNKAPAPGSLTQRKR